jgi:hypothetical protein
VTPRLRAVLVMASVLGLAFASTRFSSASYSAAKTNPGNSFVAAADFTAPSASASVIAKSAGGVSGYIKQGGTYHVYANVSDLGNPPSGVASVTADLGSVSSGQTAVALSAGSFAVDGQTFNYRSAQQTANATLAAGSYSYTLRLTDNASNAQTQGGFSVVVDNTAPSASDIQTVNKAGGIVGKAEQGDTITFSYSEQIDANSILSGWTGGSQNVVVRLTNGGGANDIVSVWNAANTSALPFGAVNLGRTDYVGSTSVTFGASGTASMMVQSGSAITVTLGTASGATSTAAGTGSMVWTPSATATDRAGNAASTTSRTETGAADKDF